MSNTTEPVSPRPVALSIEANYPSLRSRLEKAIEMYKNNMTTIGSTSLEVMSQEGFELYLVPSDLSSCTCEDSRRGNFCKHRISAGLTCASIELAQRKLPTIVKALRAYAKSSTK